MSEESKIQIKPLYEGPAQYEYKGYYEIDPKRRLQDGITTTVRNFPIRDDAGTLTGYDSVVAVPIPVAINFIRTRRSGCDVKLPDALYASEEGSRRSDSSATIAAVQMDKKGSVINRISQVRRNNERETGKTKEVTHWSTQRNSKRMRKRGLGRKEHKKLIKF